MQIRPAIYIAFANDLDHPERNLAGLAIESDNIKAAVEKIVDDNGDWQLIPTHDCTPDNLIAPFFEENIAVFHYGGHASPAQILLESADGHNQLASAPLLADFLARQQKLKLVFLNACCTKTWALNLTTLGVPCVIATSCPVQDTMALQFANKFYQSLANDRTVGEAFDDAMAGLSFTSNTVTRDIDVDPDCLHQTNGLPWALYTSNSPEARNWRLSIGANDPLLGLPALDSTQYPVPQSPYVTIEGHQESDAQVFFGRNGEIRQMFDWALKAGSPPLLLFYGQSGAGKSSLLRAGLSPRLKQKTEIKYVRRTQDLVADLHQAIGGATDAAAMAWLASEDPQVILLDQVEEAITHCDGAADEMKRFIQRLTQIFTLRDVTTHHPLAATTKARLILSFRKEYLAEIRSPLVEGLGTAAAHVVEDLWIQRLDCKALRQAVMGPVESSVPAKTYGISVPEPDFADLVVNTLDDGSSPVGPVMQILLREMWERAKAAANGGAPVFTKQLFREVASSNPLKDFLLKQLAVIGSHCESTKVDQGLELDLLYEHTTMMVTTQRRTLSYLTKAYPHVPNLNALLTINEGEDVRLLVEAADATDGAAAEPATTLVHDTLAAVVRREYELSLLPGPRARRILENRVRDWSEKDDSDPLDRTELRTVERGLAHMRLPTKDETDLLEASRKRRRMQLLRDAAVVPLFLLLLAYGVYSSRQSDRIAALVKQSADSLRHSEELEALLQSMQSAHDLDNASFTARWIRPGLRNEVTESLRDALTRTSQVGEYPFNETLRRAGDCVAAFNREDQLRLRLDGETEWMDGQQVPSVFRQPGTELNICDPRTGSFARVNGAAIETWRAAAGMDSIPTGSTPGSSVESLAFDGNDDRIGLGTFQLPGSHQIEVLTVKHVGEVLHLTDLAQDLALNQDGSLFGSVGTKVEVRRTADGKTVLQWETGRWSQPMFGTTATGIPFFAARLDRRDTTSGRYSILRLQNLNAPDAAPLEYKFVWVSPEGTREHPTAYTVSRHGTLLATGTEEGELDVRRIPADLSNPEAERAALVEGHLSPTLAVGISPDDQYIAAAFGTSKKEIIKVFGLGLGQEQKDAKTMPLGRLESLGCKRLGIYLGQAAETQKAAQFGKSIGVNLKALASGCRAR